MPLLLFYPGANANNIRADYDNTELQQAQPFGLHIMDDHANCYRLNGLITRGLIPKLDSIANGVETFEESLTLEIESSR